MIKGHCKTNVDKYKGEAWPTVFAAVPRKGDWVKSIDEKILQVVQVTHTSGVQAEQHPYENEPYIEVELHLISNTIVKYHGEL